jgi:hypothetical protein
MKSGKEDEEDEDEKTMSVDINGSSDEATGGGDEKEDGEWRTEDEAAGEEEETAAPKKEVKIAKPKEEVKRKSSVEEKKELTTAEKKQKLEDLLKTDTHTVSVFIGVLQNLAHEVIELSDAVKKMDARITSTVSELRGEFDRGTTDAVSNAAYTIGTCMSNMLSVACEMEYSGLMQALCDAGIITPEHQARMKTSSEVRKNPALANWHVTPKPGETKEAAVERYVERRILIKK